MLTTTCPSPEKLAAFQAGRLTLGVIDDIAQHLESCPTCQTAVRQGSAAGDPLLRELKHAAGTDPYADESGCRRAVARAEAAASGESTHTRDDTADHLPQAAPTTQTLGKYQLLEPIGQGGMGTVYKAFHTLLKRTVAIKVLPPNRLKDTQAVSRFRREIEAAGRLDHPHIVRTSDADEADGQHFLVMEWLAGDDLAKYVRNRDALPLDQACNFIRQAALGLQCAHEHDMVHRDVKPSNLLLTRGADGQPLVKVLDLGLALLHDNLAAEGDLTSAGQVMGTFDYIAPEQAAESHKVDARADIYSLGCTLYFLLTGRAPFQGMSAPKKLIAHQQMEPPSVADFRSDVPREVLAILAKMMAKQPAQRFASMSAVAAALEKFASPPVTASTISAVMPAPPRRRPLLVAALLLLCGLLVAAGAYGIIRVTTPEGDYVIETDDPKIKLSVSKGIVTLQDDATNRTYTMKAVRKADGLYELDVRDVGADLSFKTDKLTIKRGETLALTAHFERKVPPPPPPVNTDPVGEMRRYIGHPLPVRCVAVSPDAKAIVSGGSWGAETTGDPWLWDIDRTSVSKRLAIMQGAVNGVAFSHDGRYVIAGGQAGVVRAWDAKTGKKTHDIESFQVGGAEITCVIAAPDRPVVFYCDKGGCRACDLEKNKRLEPSYQGERASISRDGRRLLTSEGRSLRLWDVDSGKEIGQVELPLSISALALAPDGCHAIASAGPVIHQWDMVAKKLVRRIEGSEGKVQALAIAPDGKRAASGGADKRVRLWDLENGKELHAFEGHTGPITCIAYLPDGSRVLSGSDDKTIRLWQLPTTGQEKKNESKKTDPPLPSGAIRLELITKLGIEAKVEVAATDLSNQFYSSLIGVTVKQILKTPEARDGGPERVGLDLGHGVSLLIPLLQIKSIEAEDGQHALTLSDGSKQRGKLLTAVLDKEKRTWNLADLQSAKVIAHGYVEPTLTANAKTLLTLPAPLGLEYRLSSYGLQSADTAVGTEAKLSVNNMVQTLDLADFDKVAVSAAKGTDWEMRTTAPNGKISTGTWNITHPGSSYKRWALAGSTRNGWQVLIVYANMTTSGFTLEKLSGNAALPKAPKGQEKKYETKKTDPPLPSGALRLDVVTKLGIEAQVEVARTDLSDQFYRSLHRVSAVQVLKAPAPSDGGPERIGISVGHGVSLLIPLRQIKSIEAQENQHVLTLADGSKQQGKLFTTVVGKDKKQWILADAQTVKVVASDYVLPGPTLDPRTLLTLPAPVALDFRLTSYHLQSAGTDFGKLARVIVAGSAITPDLDDFQKVTVTAMDGKWWEMRLTTPTGKISAGTWDITHPSSSYKRWSLVGATRNGWHVAIVYANMTTSGFSLEKLEAASPPQPKSACAELSDGVVQLAASRDGGKVVAYTSDKTLSLWELDAGKGLFKQSWNQEFQRVYQLALDPAGNKILLGISGSSDLYVVDAQTQKNSPLPGIFRSNVVVLSPDARRYLVGSPFEGFRLCRWPDGSSVRSFSNREHAVQQLCFSRDGERILSTGEDRTVRLWDATNGEEIRKLPTFPAAKKRFIALSPDGKQALVSQDNDVQVWDLETGKPGIVLKGHKDHVTALAYGPDGRWAVSASSDQTLRVWDVGTGNVLAKLEGHMDHVTCVAVADQGRLIFSGSRDKTLRAWRWPQ